MSALESLAFGTATAFAMVLAAWGYLWHERRKQEDEPAPDSLFNRPRFL